MTSINIWSFGFKLLLLISHRILITHLSFPLIFNFTLNDLKISILHTSNYPVKRQLSVSSLSIVITNLLSVTVYNYIYCSTLLNGMIFILSICFNFEVKCRWHSENPDVLFSAYEDPASQSYPDLTLTITHALQAGYGFSVSKRMRESVSEWASLARSRIRESILRRRGTLSGVWRGSKKTRAPPSRGPKKRVPSRAAGRGDVTRCKKGARAKREVVNLSLLLGNRNSF